MKNHSMTCLSKVAFVLGVMVAPVCLAQQAVPQDEPTLGADTGTETGVLVLSSQAAALRDLIASAGPQAEALRAFYAARDYAPVWTDDRKAALLAALAEAGRHGLPAQRYDSDGLAILLTSDETPAEIAELAASRTLLTYVRDIGSGLLEPERVDRNIVVAPRRPEGAAVLQAWARARDPVAHLASVVPSDPQYGRLLDEKLRLEALILAGGWGEPVPSGPSLKPGAISQRVVALRARLERIEGNVHGDSPVYDDALVEAVKSFQARHGLNADGVAGPRTLIAINASVEDRLRQVIVNLERQRWLNYDRGARHIMVNQTDYSVRIVDDGEVTFRSRVVIGLPKHQTQEFNDVMDHMVINPTWNVPRSIATEEMLPKLKRNPGALGSSMQVMTRNGTRVNPAYVDFTQFTQSNFPFLIKQRPGDGNALGKVKFMFPNRFNIYLHDTPAKSLFNRDARAYSHGCVRVQEPFEFAYALLAPQSDDPQGLFQSLLAGGKERRLNLDVPVPIYLTYHSAFVDDAGVPQYREDVYGRDGRVFGALADAGVDLATVDG